MKKITKSAKKTSNNAVTVQQSGTNNKNFNTIHYHCSTQSDEEEATVLRQLCELQARLIKLYQTRDHAA